LKVNQKIDRKEVLRKLINMQFERVKDELRMGTFRLRGQTLEIMPVNKRVIYKLDISDKINLIETIDPIRRHIIEQNKIIYLFSSKHYVISEERKKEAIREIRSDLEKRLNFFKKNSKRLEYERLKRE
jgi:excinuclease ABC subunit B